MNFSSMLKMYAQAPNGLEPQNLYFLARAIVYSWWGESLSDRNATYVEKSGPYRARCWQDMGQPTLQQLTMTFPFYVKSIVKYRSPHPQDLSFLKGEIIRVFGYADRAVEASESADPYDEDEDDRWYMGESLDGSKQGQFPASLVEYTEYSVETQPSSQDEGAQPNSAVLSQASPIIEERAAEMEYAGMQKTSETPKDDLKSSQDADIPTVTKEANALPVEDTNQEATRVDRIHQDTAAESVTSSQTSPSEVNTNQTEIIPHEFTPPDTLASPAELSAVESKLQQEPKTENYDETPSATNTVGSQTMEADEKASEPSEIDPSRMSLRDRIAAFNKTANKTPPPIPKGKPSTWKRPSISNNAEKPLLPNQVPPALAATTVPRVQKAPDTSDCDASADTGSSSFSASDAKSSIKMSLKERMAALQRGHEGGTTIPAPSSERAVPVVVKQEEQTQANITNTTEDEATRRAAIAKRMAALGGRRVDAGLFSSSIAPTSEPTVVTEKQPEKDEMEATKEKMESPVENGSHTDAPQPLVVPKRTAAPRTRRSKPAESDSSVSQEPEKTLMNNDGPETTASDPVLPPQDRGLKSSMEQDATPGQVCYDHAIEPSGSNLDTTPLSSDLEERLGGTSLAENDGISFQETAPLQNLQSTVPAVSEIDGSPERAEEGAQQVQEGVALSPEDPIETGPSSYVTRASEEQNHISSQEEPVSQLSPSDTLDSHSPVNVPDMKDERAQVSVVTRLMPASAVQDSPAHTEDQVASSSVTSPTMPAPVNSSFPVIPGAEYVSPASFSSPQLARPAQPVDRTVHNASEPVALPVNPPSMPVVKDPLERHNSSKQFDDGNNDFSTQHELLNQLLQCNTEAPPVQTDSDETAKPDIPKKDNFVQQEDPEVSEKTRREAIARRLARMGGQRIAGLGPIPVQTTPSPLAEPVEGMQEAPVQEVPSSMTRESTLVENQDLRSPTSPPLRTPPCIPTPGAELPNGHQEYGAVVDEDAFHKTNRPTRPPPRAPPRAPPPVPE